MTRRSGLCRLNGAMPETLITATALTKSFGETRALASVDLVVSRGESLAIMGASGSGKTTLLHVLAGITLPDSGTVAFESASGRVDVASLGEGDRSRLRRESFGFVFQSGFLIPELTSVENVAIALMLTGVSRTESQSRASTLLASLGLAGLDDRRIGQLSGGQAQRVAIARAQVTGASVTFADEPTGALDSHTSADVMDALIASTTGQGRTLVVVTHDTEVARRCSRVVHMRDGRLLSPQVSA